MVITVILICIAAINLSVYFTYIDKGSTNPETEEIATIDTVELSENFQNIFDNTLDTQSSNISTNKINQDKPLVDTRYKKQDKKDQVYEININIPYININHQVANTINQEISTIFYNKVDSIIAQTSPVQIIYNVDYKAYINDNILSLVIKSTLKEGNNAQRLMIQTYNYNISSNERMDINKVLEARSLNSKAVQKRITDTITKAASTASAYKELGYDKYLRNKDDAIYKIENTTTFFLGEEKSLYIIYAYGNKNFTSEFDLVVI